MAQVTERTMKWITEDTTMKTMIGQEGYGHRLNIGNYYRESKVGGLVVVHLVVSAHIIICKDPGSSFQSPPARGKL